MSYSFPPGQSVINLNLNVVASRLQKEKSDVIIADGTEQTLLEYIGLGKISGNIDLSNIQVGDTVILKQYIQVTVGGGWKKYMSESYSGLQANPLVYITPKETDFGIKITLEQTAGVMRNYEYNFMKEI